MIIDAPIKVLDKGYVKYVGHMGSDESFVEAARMSTGKGFFGWYWDKDTYSDCICSICDTHNLLETLAVTDGIVSAPICNNCWNPTVYAFGNDEQWKYVGCPKPRLLGKEGQPRDLGLLNTLYANKHQTPFEMGELCIEVKAPIVVFREWHRHRTQSYNEFSARYSQMPNEHYIPDPSRIQKQSKTNKQGSAGQVEDVLATSVLTDLEKQQKDIYKTYDNWVGLGVAKEIARLNTPVSRYSKMRAKTDIRNWLAFLQLRMELGAQWEIRQYAHAVAEIVHALFPKTYDLFLEHDLMGVRFSRSEMRILRNIIGATSAKDTLLNDMILTLTTRPEKHTDKDIRSVFKKLTDDREELYKDAIKS